jgi:hypothetical protein
VTNTDIRNINRRLLDNTLPNRLRHDKLSLFFRDIKPVSHSGHTIHASEFRSFTDVNDIEVHDWHP